MSLTSLLQGSPEHYSITGDESHLTVKGSSGFVVEFNNYSYNVNDPMLLTSLLHGAPQFHKYMYMYDSQVLFVLQDEYNIQCITIGAFCARVM